MMRFLFLTTNFAPRGTSHAVRTVHLTKYLERLGHHVTVLTYNADAQLLFSPPDQSLVDKVPAMVDVQRIRPGPLHRLVAGAKRQGRDARRLRSSGSRSFLSQFIVPDPHICAYRTFQRTAARFIAAHAACRIVTFAYPFTLTLVGAALKRRFPTATWIADYGDPWTGSPVTELRLHGWRRALDARLESRALALADAVTVTTEPTAQLYHHQFPHLGERIHVLTMGYDPEDTARIAAAPRPLEDQGKVVMLHAGRLYPEARDPEPFIRAVTTCRATDPELTSRLKVVLLGEVDPAVVAAIRRSPVADIFEIQGWVTVEESLARMKGADYLLLFGNTGDMQIPGKVYQYFGTGRPVFMTCESPDDPTAAIVRCYGRGNVVRNEMEALTRALREIIACRKDFPAAAGTCEEFSWLHLAKKLATIAASAGPSTANGTAKASS